MHVHMVLLILDCDHNEVFPVDVAVIVDFSVF